MTDSIRNRVRVMVRLCLMDRVNVMDSISIDVNIMVTINIIATLGQVRFQLVLESGSWLGFGLGLLLGLG